MIWDRFTASPDDLEIKAQANDDDATEAVLEASDAMQGDDPAAAAVLAAFDVMQAGAPDDPPLESAATRVQKEWALRRAKARRPRPQDTPTLQDPPSVWVRYLETADAEGGAALAMADQHLAAYQEQLRTFGFNVPFFEVPDDEFLAEFDPQDEADVAGGDEAKSGWEGVRRAADGKWTFTTGDHSGPPTSGMTAGQRAAATRQATRNDAAGGGATKPGGKPTTATPKTTANLSPAQKAWATRKAKADAAAAGQQPPTTAAKPVAVTPKLAKPAAADGAKPGKFDPATRFDRDKFSPPHAAAVEKALAAVPEDHRVLYEKMLGRPLHIQGEFKGQALQMSGGAGVYMPRKYVEAPDHQMGDIVVREWKVRGSANSLPEATFHNTLHEIGHAINHAVELKQLGVAPGIGGDHPSTMKLEKLFQREAQRFDARYFRVAADVREAFAEVYAATRTGHSREGDILYKDGQWTSSSTRKDNMAPYKVAFFQKAQKLINANMRANGMSELR